MRVLTWNINGVRTLPQYHPWNTLKTFDDILNRLEADIVAFQEMKSSRQILPKQVALPPSFDSFFSFPTRKTGYSGTALYTRKSVAVPLKAEEGLSGTLQPRPPLSESELISRYDAYPPHIHDENTRQLDFKDLDSEGRAVVVDFGLFVLINVYCPNDGTGSEERETFKMDYHRLLEMRILSLIKEGREVMVVGDLNACSSVDDHCEGRIMVEQGLAAGLQGEEGFWGKECRRWLRDLIIQGDGTGIMVDIVRKFWPDRQAMYTCWNTKISARATNYGTRIDFILITPGLVPWIKAADIQPSLKGSDHCPVYVDLHDEIVNIDGSKTRLLDVLGNILVGKESAEPPRLAAKYWDEHKQKLLSTFFGKKSSEAQVERISSKTPSLDASDDRLSLRTPTPVTHDTNSPIDPVTNLTVSSITATSVVSDISTPSLPIEQPVPITKRKLAPEEKSSIKKQKLTESRDSCTTKSKQSGQTTLAGFFGQLKAPSSKSSLRLKSKTETCNEGDGHVVSDDIPDEDADYRFALQLSQSEENISPLPSSSQGSSNGSSKDKWTSILAPTKPPYCSVHNEPAKEFTVNKPGPNKGKRFFVCARPVGPGYDKGHAERLRQHVDPQYKCNFFMWASDARKEMVKEKEST